jgi:hypothetical protein
MAATSSASGASSHSESESYHATEEMSYLRKDLQHTDKKEEKKFLIYWEIQSGAVAKSYMKKGFLIYVEIK